MDFGKLDPVVAAAVSEETGGDPGRELAVLIHVTATLSRDEAERQSRRLALEQPMKPGGVLSMTLSARRIGELSEEPWVVAIRAARRLRTLDEPGTE